MKAQVRTRIIVIAVTSVLAACASKAPVSPPAVASASASSAPATAAAEPNKGRNPADNYRRVVKKNGLEYFCRKEGVTGSRTQVIETCLTQAQLTLLRENSQEFTRRVQESIRNGAADPQEIRTLDSNYMPPGSDRPPGSP